MNYKDFLIDKAFWILFLPVFRGCVIYGVIVLVLLLFLAFLSQSWIALLYTIQTAMPQIIKWSIFLSVLINIGVLLLSLNATIQYFSNPPQNTNSFLVTIRDLNKSNKGSLGVSEQVVPFIFLIIVLSGLFNAYILEEGNRNAMQLEIAFVLPFSMGFLSAYGIRAAILIVLLHLKYVIQTMNR